MKKLFSLITLLCLCINSFAAFAIKPRTTNAAEIFLPVGRNQKISLLELSTISVKDYQVFTGQKLNFFARIAFKGEQKKIKNYLNPDGTVDNKRFLNFTDGDGDRSTGIHWGGFLLGFFLLPIGVLIAYLSGGDEDVRRNRIRWAWRGSLASITIILAILKSSF